MQKTKILITLFLLLVPFSAAALQMPVDGNDLAAMVGINAKAYIVEDVDSGQVLISQNADLQWTPASLTKLVTALVVLDSKVPLTKQVTMTAADQTVGGCTVGGVCIKDKPGVTKFTVDGLFHAALMPSANNAADALSRSTGLSQTAFVKLMNQKAAALGATNTHFNEPTGMDPDNKITAADYVRIVQAAFSNPYLQQIAGLSQYTLRSTNQSGYNQVIKNTDQLVSDPDIQMIGAKTGYLDESQYNFASLLKDDGDELAIVVLGEPHLYSAFAETKTLAGLAQDARFLAMLNPAGQVLGTSTTLSISMQNN